MFSTFARAVVASTAFALTAGAWSGAGLAQEKELERTITVSATGEASAEPDIAHIASGVTTEADTAKAALAENNAVMAKLIAGLKENGIDAKDIQTSSFHVEPRYTNPRDGKPPEINGYRATNQVQVTVRDLDRLGDVLDALVSLGANQMGGLTFGVSKAETLKDEARAEAVANALRRAKLIASAAGADVGEVIAIVEDAAEFVPVGRPMARAMKAEAVPIERGTETLEARVTVTWALK